MNESNPYEAPATGTAETVPEITASLSDAKPLLADQAFWGLAITQFLGAFNDNLFKQLILLLSVPVVVVGVGEAIKAGEVGEDVQGWATMVFSIPFVIFSGYAGFLSDRYPKRNVIVLAKAAEIVVMVLGMIAFLCYGLFAALGTWSVLFLMGTHSTFFGPGKYGVLPELFRKQDLPKANGLILMSTFLAIILGTVTAGFLFDKFVVLDNNGNTDATSLWFGSLVCLAIAGIGTWTATWIRRSPAAQPQSVLTAEDWGVSQPVRKLLTTDRALLNALLVSCVFWLVSGISLPIVNRLGTGQLGLNKFNTSLLVASIAVGIAVGAIISGTVFKRLKAPEQVKLGLFGICLSMVVLGCWKGQGEHLLGFQGSFIGLLFLGIFAAIYAVPLQVFLQDRPPAELKGRMIATMNQANFVGILASGFLYQLLEKLARFLGWPISSIFWMLAIMVLPLAIFYRLGGKAHSQET